MASTAPTHLEFDRPPEGDELDHLFPVPGMSHLRLREQGALLTLETPPIPWRAAAIIMGALMVGITVAFFLVPQQGGELPAAFDGMMGPLFLAFGWFLAYPGAVGLLWFADRSARGRGPGAILDRDRKMLRLPWCEREISLDQILAVVEVREVTRSGGHANVKVQGTVFARLEGGRFLYAPIGYGLHRQDLAVLRNFAKELGTTVRSIGKVSEELWARSDRTHDGQL